MLRFNMEATGQRIVPGVLVTLFVVYQLADRIMQGGTGESISFSEFFTFYNLTFCFYMGVMFIAGWFMQGRNNKQVMTCWLIGVISAIFLYYEIAEYFLYETRNIYVLAFATSFTNIVWFLTFNNRIELTTCLHKVLKKNGSVSNGNDNKPTRTNMEILLRGYVSIYFAYELLVSFIFVFYGIFYGVPVDGSLYDTMSKNQHPDLFELYFSLQSLFSLYISLILLYCLKRDIESPDCIGVNLNDEQKRRFINEMKKKFKN